MRYHQETGEKRVVQDESEDIGLGLGWGRVPPPVKITETSQVERIAGDWDAVRDLRERVLALEDARQIQSDEIAALHARIDELLVQRAKARSSFVKA